MTADPPDGGRSSADRRGQSQPDPWGAFSLLVSGILVWGGVGWLVARWLDNQVFLMLGLLVGMGASLYLVWLRYGKP